MSLLFLPLRQTNTDSQPDLILSHFISEFVFQQPTCIPKTSPCRSWRPIFSRDSTSVLAAWWSIRCPGISSTAETRNRSTEWSASGSGGWDWLLILECWHPGRNSCINCRIIKCDDACHRCGRPNNRGEQRMAWAQCTVFRWNTNSFCRHEIGWRIKADK